MSVCILQGGVCVHAAVRLMIASLNHCLSWLSGCVWSLRCAASPAITLKSGKENIYTSNEPWSVSVRAQVCVSSYCKDVEYCKCLVSISVCTIFLYVNLLFARTGLCVHVRGCSSKCEYVFHLLCECFLIKVSVDSKGHFFMLHWTVAESN